MSRALAVLLLIIQFCPALSAQITWPKISVRNLPTPSRTPSTANSTTNTSNSTSSGADDITKAFTYCMVLNQTELYVTPLMSYTKDPQRTSFRRLAESWRDYANQTLHLGNNGFCNATPTTEANMANYRKLNVERNEQAGKKVVDVNWTFDSSAPPAVQNASLAVSAVPIPAFKSEDARTCWTYFMRPGPHSPSGSEAAVAACQKAGKTGPPAEPRINPFQGDPVAQAALGFSYITGNGVPVNREQGLTWLEVAARGGGGWAGADCSRPVFPPAMLMAAALLWNNNAWWNTDTFHMVWAQPTDHWTNARKWISMNQAREFVRCAAYSQDPAYAQLAQQMKKQMPDWQMPLYDPRTSGTSTTHMNVSRYGNGPASPEEMVFLFILAFGMATPGGQPTGDSMVIGDRCFFTHTGTFADHGPTLSGACVP